MVLNKASPKERADIMCKFINAGTVKTFLTDFFEIFFLQVLLRLKNFNTLMAVIGGLKHSSIARLGKTYTCIPMEMKRVCFEQL
jgi:RAS guanyl-releasing protein 3